MEDSLEKIALIAMSENVKLKEFKAAAIDFVYELLLLNSENAKLIEKHHGLHRGFLTSHREVVRVWCLRTALHALHHHLRFRYKLSKSKQNLISFLKSLKEDDQISINHTVFIDRLKNKTHSVDLKNTINDLRDRYMKKMEIGV